jgi:hypothetical protein
MVIYILEQRALFKAGQIQFVKPADQVAAKSQLHDYQINTWVGSLKEPYSLAFLSPELAIMTEKRGHAYLIEKGKIAARPLIGLPLVDTAGQAGLFDVVAHPDYAKNGWVYFAFSDPQKNARGEPVSLTRIVRGKINAKEGAFVEPETIFQAKSEHYVKAGGVHFGGRMVFDRQGLPVPHYRRTRRQDRRAGSRAARRQGPPPPRRRPRARRQSVCQPAGGARDDLELRPPQPAGPRPRSRHRRALQHRARPARRRRTQPRRARPQLRLARHHLRHGTTTAAP